MYITNPRVNIEKAHYQFIVCYKCDKCGKFITYRQANISHISDPRYKEACRSCELKFREQHRCI